MLLSRISSALSHLHTQSSSAASVVFGFSENPHEGQSCSGQQKPPLVVFSGSFNPLTVSHSQMCVEACKALSSSNALLLLPTNNADKGAGQLSAELRLEMLCEFAAEQNSQCESALEWGVAACNKGRFIEQAFALGEIYPGHSLHFIVGFDTLIRIFNPKYYDDLDEAMSALFSKCNLVCFNRGQDGKDEISAFMKREEAIKYSRNVHIMEMTKEFVDISSTMVRNRVNTGESIAHLTPDSVIKFIQLKQLYVEK